MKNIKALIIVFLIFIIGASCKKSFFDINQNPNQVTDVSYKLVLPSALAQVGSNISSGLDFANYWMGFWAQNGGTALNSTEVQFLFSNTYYQGVWTNFYYAINNLNYVEQSATTSNDNFYVGIAKTMKVLCYHNLIDLYGNVPYSQALQINNYPRPAYDDAATIYKDLFVQLDTARSLISKWKGDSPAPTSDIMLSGNKIKWLKFINTLELRMLLRFSEIAKPSYYSTVLANVSNDANGFLGVSESVLVNPGYSNSNNDRQNPFYGDYGFDYVGNPTSNNSYIRANSYAINFYQTTFDPRIAFFYSAYDGSNYAGNDFGLQGQANNVISGIGQATKDNNNIGILNSPSQSAPILTSFESLFLQAEAAKRGMINLDYKVLYKSAILESFKYMNIDTAQASALYEQADNATLIEQVNIDSTTNPLKTILTQKWASINAINPLEVYADYRRTGIPDVPGTKALNNGVKRPIPLRMYYPNTEKQTNPDNVASQGNITLYSKIFWIP
jgi:hypothetical protein